MTAERHVLTEKATIFGWNDIRSEHSRFCKEDALTHAYFNGKDLVVDIEMEKSSDGTAYRMLKPKHRNSPTTMDDIMKRVKEKNLTFVHVIIDALRKEYHNECVSDICERFGISKSYYDEWISVICRQLDINNYLPYVFFNNGLLELHIAEFQTPTGEHEFILLPQ